YKEELKALELVVSHNVPEHIIEKCKKVNEGDCLCGLAIKERRIMFIPQGAYPEHSEEEDFPHNHYLIPVYDNEGVYALFNLYTKKETIEPQEEGFAIAVATAVRNGIKRILLKDNLRLSLETFHLSVDNFPLPVVIFTEGSKIVHINQRFKEKIGDDFKTVESIMKSILPEEEAEKLMFVLYPDQWKGLEGVEIFDRKRDKRQINLYIGPVGRVEGQKYYMLVLEDITEEEILKRQLIQSQKMEAVARLSGGVAHDFNNILGAVMGHTELALTRIEKDHPAHVHLKAILNAAQRASLLTGQLLAFSKRQMTNPRPLDVNTIIGSLLRFIERILGEDIQLSFQKKEPLPPVMADPVQIEQILLNLLVNARDAMPDGGSVEVSTDAQGDHVIISVSDTGPGIPEEIQERIFEPFFTTKPEGKGTGLGLSTVKSIVEELNGRIEFSTAPQKGTTFRVFIPVCETPQKMETEVEKKEPIQPERIPLKGNVVVVEDDTDVRDVLRDYLEFLGIKTKVVEEPERAFEAIDKDTEILITDLVMPGLNGLSIAEEAKKKWPSLKVLFITGFVADNELLNEVEKRKLHVLTKPFTLKQLTDTIRTLLL
ncbi:MAG: response regulator, partial [Nitrospirae bacterium]